MLQLHESEDDDISVDLTGRNTNLSNLFEDNISDQPLSYTAPKDPKSIIKTTPQAINREKTPLLASCTVNVFKLVNNVYESIGRVNAALFNANDKVTLIFYKTKQVQIVSVEVNKDFKFNILDNNYSSFYDSSRQQWSVLFESESKLSYFTKQIVYSKLKSCENGEISSFSQDLNSISDGPVVSKTSSVELNLFITDGDLNNSILHDKFKVKIDSGKLNSLLEKAIIGMKLNSEIVVVLTDKDVERNKIPKLENYELYVIHVTVLRVKENKIESIIPKSENIKTEVKNAEKLAEAETDKEAILKRMSRMGQAMFPGASISANGDKKPNACINTVQPPPPQIPSKPVVHAGVSNAGPEQRADTVVALVHASSSQKVVQSTIIPVADASNRTSPETKQILSFAENQSVVTEETRGVNTSLLSNGQLHASHLADHSCQSTLVDDVRHDNRKMAAQLTDIQTDSADLKSNMTCLQRSLDEIKSFLTKDQVDPEVKMYYKSIKDIFEENNQLKKDLWNKNEKVEKLNNLITDKLLEIKSHDPNTNQLKEENFDLKIKIKELSKEIQDSKGEHSEKSAKVQNSEFNCDLKNIMTNLYMETKESFSEINDITNDKALDIVLSCIKKITSENLKNV